MCTKEELCAIVTATSPLCLCTADTKEYVQCEICSHTACTACGQHPRHEYNSVPAVTREPHNAEEVGRLLPPGVELSGAGVPLVYYQCSSGVGVASWHATWDTHPPTRELRCTVWTRPYPRVVWQVGDSRLGVVDGGEITKGVWTMLATPSYSRTGVVSASDQAVVVGGWLQHLGKRGGGTRPTVVEFQNMGPVSGVYVLAQHCDAPCNSLYARADRSCWFVFDTNPRWGAAADDPATKQTSGQRSPDDSDCHCIPGKIHQFWIRLGSK